MLGRGALWLLAPLLLAGCVGLPGAPSAPPAGEGEDAPVAPTPAPTPRSRPLPAPALPGLEGQGGEGAPEASPPRPPPEAPPSDDGGNGTSAPESAPAAPSPPPPSPAPSPQPAPPPSSPPPSSGGGSSASPGLPVVFRAGRDAGAAPWVSSFQLAPDGSSFSAGLRGVAGARLRVESLVFLVNQDDAPRTVVLRTDPATSPRVLEARLSFRDPAGPLVGALDLRDAAPSLSFVLAPGAAYEGEWALALAEDASGADALQRSIVLDVRS